MRDLWLIGLGFVLLVLQSVVTVHVPLDPWLPHLLLPMTVYLGVASDVSWVRGALLAFILGSFLDSFCGSALGLQTFVLVATFLLARGAGLRLFSRGIGFHMALSALVTLFSTGAVLALRAIFERQAPIAVPGVWPTLRSMLAQAAATALVAPWVFAAVRRVHAVGESQEEGAAASA